MTERQLLAGIVPEAPVLLVPNARHLPNDAIATLQHYRGRLVLVGDERVLRFDEYDQPRQAISAERLAYTLGETTAQALWAELCRRLPSWNITPAVAV